MSDRSYLYILTKQSSFKISPRAEIEQEGTLTKFFIDGSLVLAVNIDDFIQCQLIEVA